MLSLVSVWNGSCQLSVVMMRCAPKPQSMVNAVAVHCRLIFSFQDAGEYHAARQLLDEGEAYISMPTQQKVMTKVRTYSM